MRKVYVRMALVAGLLMLLLQQIDGQQYREVFAERGEKYFQFVISSEAEFRMVADMISIDHIKGDTITGNASYEEFQNFLKLSIDFEFLPHPSDLLSDKALAYHEIPETRSWNFYPTYDAYLQIMEDFENDHPSLCEIQNIGTLPSGRKLLAAKITSPGPAATPKPKFLYTATMHGDELTGYVLSLRLIDHLLENYGSDAFVTRLVDSVEIWINPLANPDGTYFAGNHTISGARRRNANGVDLNRNFPDPVAGPNPDGNAWQPETIHFMNHAGQHKFNLSSNWHGGAEVCNYPWDTWAHLTADNAWWVYTMREYADTVHKYSPSPYFRGFNAGITNGFAWYRITGGRQDYMNYFQQCREFTLELTNQKIPPASQLPVFWDYNYRSFLNYIEQALYGIRGVVTDAGSGVPVHAMLRIENHDADSSYVFSNAQTGGYHRYLKTGTYDLTFKGLCYELFTVEGVSVTDRQTTWLDVQLQPLAQDIESTGREISPGNSISFTAIECTPIDSVRWIFPGGVPTVSNTLSQEVYYQNEGIFDVMMIAFRNSESDTALLREYVKVSSIHLMKNGHVYTCLSDFYDSGGPYANYFNNENRTLTFFPLSAGTKTEVAFLSFNTQANADYLYAYDGAGISSPQFAGSPFHGTALPASLTATNTDGAITFRFVSNSSVTRSGWAAKVRCRGVAFEQNLTGFAYANDDTCFAAIQTLNIAANEQIFYALPASLLTLTAGVRVILHPGTHLLYGSHVLVFIDDENFCYQTRNLQSQPIAQHAVVPTPGETTDSPLLYRIYPNPGRGVFTIEFFEFTSFEAPVVEVFNLLGKRIATLTALTDGILQTDLQRFPPGIYIFRITQNSTVSAVRVVKM